MFALAAGEGVGSREISDQVAARISERQSGFYGILKIKRETNVYNYSQQHQEI
jgi:hypothetical protein